VGSWVHTVGDSREGWVDSLRLLIRAVVLGGDVPRFDYSAVRPRGEPIRGFGGVSQGPEILEALHADVAEALAPLHGRAMSVTGIVDVMNLIGKCVVAGNVRRTAEIAFGDPDSEEYLSLKDFSARPERAGHAWLSNNSVFARVGMDYGPACERVRLNGEPGFAWLDNMRAYGRMGDPPDHADERAAGGNPCLEQTLESHEMCCLVETLPHRHGGDAAEFSRTLESALLYAKTVTLGAAQWGPTNAVMLRNRRIGTSMTGLAQFVAARGVEELRAWCDGGYRALRAADARESERLGVAPSIKVSCVKPSGTVSLLAGSTPGLHFPESRFYVRRVRLAVDSDLLPPLRAAGLPVEPAETDPEGTVVVEFPVDAGEGVRTLGEVSMWEQLGLAAFMQRHWADNQVSCTVTFDPEREGPQLPHALDVYQYQLKGVSFLPRLEHGAFAQMPYEAISEGDYRARAAALRPVDFDRADLPAPGGGVVEVPDKYCSTCSLDGV